MASDQPWFKFYSADYLLDPKVDAMPREAEALLIRMWCLCHREGCCPADVETLSRKTLCNPEYVSQWKAHCEPFFELKDGKFYSRRMQAEKQRSEQARKNANNRYAPKSKSKSYSESESESERGSANGSADGSAIGSANGTANQTRGADAPPPAAAHAPKSRSTQMPAGFRPSAGHQTLARELGVDLETAFAAFTDHHLAKGNRFKDWNRALNMWLRNEHKFAPKGVRNENRAERRQTDNLAAAAAVKRDLGLAS